MASIEQLERALRNADAAGDEEAARRFAQEIISMRNKPEAQEPKQPEEKPKATGGYGRNIGRQLLQGLTLGYGDEIASGIAAVPASIATGNNYFDVYKDIRNDEREQVKRFAENNPKAALASNVAGGLLTGGAGAVRSGAAKSLPKLAAYGAGTGAVAGLGASDKESLEQAAIDTGVGAGVGGVFGAAIPGAGRAIGAGAKKLLSPNKTRDGVKNAVKTELNRSNVSPEEALGRLQSNPNLFVGALSNDLQKRTGALAGLPGGGVIKDKLDDVVRGQASRIIPEIRDGLGADAKYYDALPKLTEDMKRLAAPLYDKAYRTPINEVPVKVSKILVEAEKNGALRNARKLAAGELKDYDDMQAFQGLDYLKRSLQDMESTFIRAGKNQLAAAYGNQRRTIGDFLKSKSPDYARANKIWSNGSRDQEAMEMGLTALSKPEALNRSMIKDMSKAERKAFRIGLMQGFENMIGRTRETNDLVGRVKDVPQVRNLLEMAFGSKDKFRSVMKKLQDEQDMMGAVNTTRGSQTVEKSNSTRAVAELAPGLFSGSPSAVMYPIVRNVGNRLGLQPEQRSADFRGALSDALLDNNVGQDVLRGILSPAGTPRAYQLLGGAGSAAPLLQGR